MDVDAIGECSADDFTEYEKNFNDDPRDGINLEVSEGVSVHVETVDDSLDEERISNDDLTE